MINREQFMEFFRNDESLATLTADDRHEVFAGIMLGSSDFTADMLNKVLSDYGVVSLNVSKTSYSATYAKPEMKSFIMKYDCTAIKKPKALSCIPKDKTLLCLKSFGQFDVVDNQYRWDHSVAGRKGADYTRTYVLIHNSKLPELIKEGGDLRHWMEH